MDVDEGQRASRRLGLASGIPLTPEPCPVAASGFPTANDESLFGTQYSSERVIDDVVHVMCTTDLADSFQTTIPAYLLGTPTLSVQMDYGPLESYKVETSL